MSHGFALEKVEVALTPQQRFEEFLQSRGMRITQPRRIILDEVFRHHEHFDADELLAQLAANSKSKVGRATVYRTLKEMVDAGLLREMPLAGRRVYEHDYGYPQHDHMFCQKCKRLIEFSNDSVKQIREAVAREHSFKAEGHRLIIFGTCAECAKPKRRHRPLDLI